MARILLIEPDRVLAASYANAFQQDEHEVVWCSDAQQAVQIVDETQPECVVIELQLVLHNGVEFLYELRSYADLQDIPVIINSFVPPAEIPESQRQLLNVTNHLYKPQTPLSTLRQTVNNVTIVPA